MQWFRMYSEAVDDEKLRLLSFEDRWHFIAILCCKSAGIIDEGGPLMRRKLAVKLGLDLSTFEEVVRRLAEVELIDRETVQPMAWDRRQFQSDNSTERVREHRERVKQARNVSATPPETEAESEAESEEEEREREQRTPAREAGKRSPYGSRLPQDFPTADEMTWCQQERPDLDAAFVRDKFRDYWRGVAGAKGRKADWPATWRNFVRSEHLQRQALPQARASPGRLSAGERNAASIASLTGKHRQQHSEVIDVEPVERPAALMG